MLSRTIISVTQFITTLTDVSPIAIISILSRDGRNGSFRGTIPSSYSEGTIAENDSFDFAIRKFAHRKTREREYKHVAT